MRRGVPDPSIALLLELLDKAFQRKAWHGPNLRGSLRGVSAREAAWRPARGRHNIWEIVLHAAYWKYAVWRRLVGEKRGSFTLAGRNWFDRPVSPTERAWKQDITLLVEQHRRLRQAVAALPTGALRGRASRSRSARLALIRGVAFHDVYHAGQIQLLKRLHRSSRRREASP